MIAPKYLGNTFRIGLVSSMAMLGGCDWVIFDPKGQIGQDEKTLLITSVLLMALVVVPVIIMTLAFAWKYRASAKARYEPNWSHSNAIEAVVWTIPCLIILVLGVLTWRSTHELDPYKPLVSENKPVTIEAVAMDWKWLFIYPDLGIATVNEIAFPLNTPVDFKITSDTVMNSFFIPQLGSQIYAMAGMVTRLHLIANEPGQYAGISSHYSGHGFSKMKFTARAVRSQEEFDAWIKTVKTAQQALDANQIHALEQNHNVETVYPVTYFNTVDQGMFESLVGKYMTMPNDDSQLPHGQHAGMEMDMQMSMGEHVPPHAAGFTHHSVATHAPMTMSHSGD